MSEKDDSNEVNEKPDTSTDKQSSTAEETKTTDNAEEEVTRKRKPFVLKALLWKNFTLKRKRRRSTCCEIFLPIFFILLIIVLKSLTQIEDIAPGWTLDFESQCPYTNRNATSLLVQVPCEVPYEVFQRETDVYPRFFSFLAGRDLRTPFGRLCLAHSGEQREINALNNFIEFVESEGIQESGPFEGIRDAVAFFGTGTEEELQDYLKNPTYGLPFDQNAPQCLGCLVFNEIDFEKAQFSYTVRGNATLNNLYFDVIDTRRERVEFERDIDEDEYDDYMDDGWTNLAQLVDAFLIKESIKSYTTFPIRPDLDVNSRKLEEERKIFQPSNVRAIPMPTTGFTRDIFFSLVADILPLVFIVVYLMPVSQMISIIVLEKENRSRDMMRLMGVSDFQIISSWYITYTAFFIILSLLMAFGGNLMFPSTTAASSGFSIVVFFTFFAFGISMIAFSFVMSTFFKKAFNAVVFGLMIYIILFFMFYIFNENFEVNNGPLLVPQIAFAFTVQTLATFEETGIGVTGDLVSTNILGFNMLRGILWLFFDTIYLTLLGFYFNAVIPGEYGTPLPFYFPLLPKYWKSLFTRSDSGDIALIKLEEESDLKVLEGEMVEEPNDTLKEQVKHKIGVQIRNMTKIFDTPDGPKTAVDNLSLDVFEGQILVLLGHNGAGKTTTLQMLTGTLPMSQGEAFIYGSKVRTELDTIRKNLGFCPQHDVLYGELTVHDHLKFYGQIKGLKGDELEAEIDESLKQVSLTEKKYIKSKALSGGMKRKLSLAISLIGGSKVIFVDEPTSGVDTFSRRSMWEILQNAREGRVIILTTHFMDEADLLGDRIAIMAEGKLQCVGSSFFLKQSYGAGYRLIFAKKDNCDSDEVEKLIKSYVQSAEKSSDVGTELSFHLPLNQSSTFSPLFSKIDEMIEKNELQVTSYGVSVTTMEEVFLKAGQSQDLLEGFDEKEKEIDDKFESFEEEGVIEDNLFKNNGFIIFLRQFNALFLKRFSYALRDRYSFVCNTLVPVTIFCFGLLVLTITPVFDDLPPMEININDLNPTFEQNQRAFMPIIELTLENGNLDFDKGRVSQSTNFGQFNLEQPVAVVSQVVDEDEVEVRELFNQGYENGRSNNCTSPPFDCVDTMPEDVGSVVLDIGEALLTPSSEQFIQQIEDRNGASVFGAVIIHQEDTFLDSGGCFVASLEVDLATSSFVIGSQQVQCTIEDSPCVMIELDIDFPGVGDIFSCVPAGCLSDLNEDVINFFFSFISSGGGLISDDDAQELQDALFDDSSYFVCEGELCNIGPANLEDFSICRGGPSFQDNNDAPAGELCVTDDLFLLDVNFTFSENNDAIDEVSIDINENEDLYCSLRDDLDFDIEEFLELEVQESLFGKKRRLLFDTPTSSYRNRQLEGEGIVFNETNVTSCLSTDILDELQSLNNVQQALLEGSSEPSFDSNSASCVDSDQFDDCTLRVLPLTETSNICLVDRCQSSFDFIDQLEGIFGEDSIAINSILVGIGLLEQVSCSVVKEEDSICNSTTDLKVLFDTITVLQEEDLINDVVDSGLSDLLIDTALDLIQTLNPNSTEQISTNLGLAQAQSERFLSDRELQTLEFNPNCIGFEAECEVLTTGDGTICVQVDCDVEIDELNLPVSLELILGFTGLEVLSVPCSDTAQLVALNCTSDNILDATNLIDTLGGGNDGGGGQIDFEITNLEDVFETLAELNETQLLPVVLILNQALNTTFEVEEVALILDLVAENFFVVEALLVDTSVLNLLLEIGLNSGDTISVDCEEECVLIELDLDFGTVCLPAGCSSNFTADDPVSTLSEELDESFDGIHPKLFLCPTTDCNSGCALPSTCESNDFQVVIFNETESLVAEDKVCANFRFSYTMLLNTSAIHITAIVQNEVHTALLRRSLVEYFDFTSISPDSVSFNSNDELFSPFEGTQLSQPNVNFVFPNEADAPKITVTSHPMPFTQATQEIFEAIIAFTTAIFALLAFAFIPGPMISYVVMEKEEHVQVKHLQFVSGAGIWAYWLSNYVFDLVSFILPFTLSLALIQLFSVSSFIDNGAFLVVSIVFFGYGLAIIPFSYLIGHLFKKHTSALIWIIVINCLTGLTLMIASFAMDQIPETQDINQELKVIYRISPGFCLGDSLLNVAITGLTIGLLGEENSDGFFDEQVTGANIAYLYTSAIIYFAIVVFIEFSKTQPSISKYLSRKAVPKQETELEEHEIDEDVVAEAERVQKNYNARLEGNVEEERESLESGNKRDVLEMLHLRKVYGNGKVAVRDVSLGIPEGECFGYLGINGAGKTTTMKCLTGDVFPTSGTGFIRGYSVVSEQWRVRQHIGYCSQFSSILDLLTVKEHLKLFCRIKQVIVIDGTVSKLLRRLSLTPFENKLAKSLSGGNKRKLSVAIAMIGSPSVMLLDEPSTGMDVASRRFMWNVIENMVAGKYDGKKTSVVLTTHSMEECEALCSRVGIMVGGRLRCLGSVQHLKSRFGKGYTVEVKLNYITKEAVLENMKEEEEEAVISKDQFDEFFKTTENGDALKERFDENVNGVSWTIMRKLEDSVDGSIPTKHLTEWVLHQRQVLALEEFLSETFTGVQVVEVHEYRLTYRLEKNESTKLSTIFKALEENKEKLKISEYAVSQTTLEQIFNGFAAAQEEENRQPRGVTL